MTLSKSIEHLTDSDIQNIYEDLAKKNSTFPLSFLTSEVTASKITGKHIRFVRHKIYGLSEPKFAAFLQKETGLSDISSFILHRYETYGKPHAKRPRNPSVEVKELIAEVMENLQEKATEVIPNLSAKKTTDEPENAA